MTSKAGETLAVVRSQIKAVRAQQIDPSRRIEAQMDLERFRALCRDMFDETGNEAWRALNTSPLGMLPDRVDTGQQIDGAFIILSGTVSGIRVVSTNWPSSTFAS